MLLVSWLTYIKNIGYTMYDFRRSSKMIISMSIGNFEFLKYDIYYYHPLTR